ncbi:unnamed protein product, partial [Ilex paraguariensis]
SWHVLLDGPWHEIPIPRPGHSARWDLTGPEKYYQGLPGRPLDGLGGGSAICRGMEDGGWRM